MWADMKFCYHSEIDCFPVAACPEEVFHFFPEKNPIFLIRVFHPVL